MEKLGLGPLPSPDLSGRGVLSIIAPVAFAGAAAALVLGSLGRPFVVFFAELAALVYFSGIVSFCMKAARFYSGTLASSLASSYLFVLAAELAMISLGFQDRYGDGILSPPARFAWLCGFWYQAAALAVLVAARRGSIAPRAVCVAYCGATIVLLGAWLALPPLRRIPSTGWGVPHILVSVLPLAFLILAAAYRGLRRRRSELGGRFGASFVIAALSLSLSALAGAWHALRPSDPAIILSWFARFASAFFAYDAIVIHAFVAPRRAEVEELERRGRELERARAEAQGLAADLEHRLEERGLLLAEIHHRVKNNLQILSSLARLEAGKSADREIEEAFVSFERKIQSMASVHDLLYRSESFARVRLSDYLRDVASHFDQQAAGTISFAAGPGSEELLAGIERALPLGLALNELITNAAKHSGRSPEELVIGVGLEAGEDGARLSVLDNGRGYERPAEAGRLLIADALAAQAGGRLSLENRGGAFAAIDFPA